MIEEEFSPRAADHRRDTGFSPWLMRAPFGVRWFGFGGCSGGSDLLGVMWTVIGYDWNQPSRYVVQQGESGHRKRRYHLPA